jgi:DNA polymerase-4
VAAYTGPSGCILAASIEAKKLGIKTGTRVKDARTICPKIVVMEPDSPKYRTVHKKIKELLYSITPKVIPKSIDEFSIDIENTPAQKIGTIQTARQIKADIKAKVGEWITVSIGISPNIFLAKTASNLEKPDGLQIIDATNFQRVFTNLSLTELCGIKSGNASRLATQGIFSVMDFYQANIEKLCKAFGSIEGYYWHLNMRGWDVAKTLKNGVITSSNRNSFGNSYAIPGGMAKKTDLAPILYKLVEKTAIRMRNEGYKAKSFSVNILYRDGTCWKNHKSVNKYIDQTAEIYRNMFRLLAYCPHEKPVRILAETCFHMAKTNKKQLSLFENTEKSDILSETIDKINKKFGDMTVKSAELLKVETAAPDRIGFGH